jgi:SAM-dependent methyltransferase
LVTKIYKEGNLEMNPKCLICDGAVKSIDELYDDRYSYPTKFSLLECMQCKHKFLEHRFDDDDIGDLYTNFYPRSSYNENDLVTPKIGKNAILDWWGGLNSSAYRWVPAGVRVLDIGCGFGQSLRFHKARGCAAYGVEADKNVAAVAKQLDLDITIGVFDPAAFPPESFDFVTLDQVLEHVIDPKLTLEGVSRILLPTGRVIITVPNSNGLGARLFGKKWIHWHAPYHLQHYSVSSMAALAAQAGFQIEKIQTITNSRWLDYQWWHLLRYPAQGEKSTFWSNRALNDSSLSMQVMIFIARVTRFSGLNSLLTRVVDLVGKGDNHVFILSKGLK